MNKSSNKKKQVNKLLTIGFSVLGLLFLYTILSPQVKAQVYVYEDANFEGRYIILRGNISYVGNAFNDKLSSLRVPEGWEVILYEHANYQGRTKIFRENTSWVGNDFNDITSSIKIRRAANQQISVSIQFDNRTSYPVSIYWINNTERLYKNLGNNSNYSQQSYVGHRWRIKLNGKAFPDYIARNLSSQTVYIITQTIEAGPIWNQRDAEQKCNNLAGTRRSVWTGAWWTTETGRMSVCELARLSY